MFASRIILIQETLIFHEAFIYFFAIVIKLQPWLLIKFFLHWLSMWQKTLTNLYCCHLLKPMCWIVPRSHCLWLDALNTTIFMNLKYVRIHLTSLLENIERGQFKDYDGKLREWALRLFLNGIILEPLKTYDRKKKTHNMLLVILIIISN